MKERKKMVKEKICFTAFEHEQFRKQKLTNSRSSNIVTANEHTQQQQKMKIKKAINERNIHPEQKHL